MKHCVTCPVIVLSIHVCNLIEEKIFVTGKFNTLKKWNYVLGLLFAHCLGKTGQASAGDNEVKLMMKHAPEWV